ncbi:MAG: (d)CMP kinase [Candidatus Aenigmatarchaeota archaeon]
MPVIAISGLPACGNSTVAKLLAKKLKIKYFSAGKYFKAHEPDVKKETAKAVKLMRTKRGSSMSFHHSIDRLVMGKAKKGNIVIDGKIAVRMLMHNSDLRVWLTAPFNVRSQRCAKRDRITLERAKKQLREKESTERKIFKSVYGLDYFEQEKMADIVVDTSVKRPEEIANLILEKLNKTKIKVL